MGKKENNSPHNPPPTSLADALRLFHEKFSFSPGITYIPVQDSPGQITAEAIFSPLSVPAAHLSEVDGIAVRSKDTVHASKGNPVLLSDVIQVSTGNVVPSGYDAVIMNEDLEEKNGRYFIEKPVRPWHHIRPIGDDIVHNEMILPRKSTIRPADIGALISYGITEVPVCDLKVALIPTGDMIVPVGIHPEPNQMIASNLYVAAALIRSVGATVTHYPIIPDDKNKIKEAVKRAIQDHDIVLISGGSSKGKKDYTAAVIEELGTIIVNGIAIIPAKTTILGEIERKPIIGMPGYPVANYTILREIVLPLLSWYGYEIPEYPEIPVTLGSTIHSSTGFDEFVLTTVGKIADRWIAVPFPRGAGMQMHMVRSHAYLKIPAEVNELKSGDETSASLTVPRNIAEKVILVTGSHDPGIDYLSDLARDAGIHIASSHVGSMGGLFSLQQGFCHLAPMHLLADDGEYNIPYLKKHFHDEELVLICVGERIQGIVSRDNLGFEAITTHRFINRQEGSGTRILLDHLLKQKKINPASIAGYDEMVLTHPGVCLAVKNGEADLGLTLYNVAHAFSLPFVPVDVDRYELVTTKAMFEKDIRIKIIFELIKSQRFKEILIHLGGYKIDQTGCVRYCIVR
ncbi:molybdopterin biosynthesis protein [Methanospirillum hungatei]|jgi:putative molybdopterin biosynthesis protein|uniref:molybdopterin biosynthesis protein n=1 Tax=Methanospirillum hungatei TaxID=2203 RepID=UPI001B49D565|nr:molybdopterin biosynthesis protein [Methanospirillum hungatei]MBP9007354.1 molybdopterin biosynthesis protein [Methanospirillum sp.]HOW05876.1 molybdopterin biosynthesis protein [Methanospirillum hungatei]